MTPTTTSNGTIALIAGLVLSIVIVIVKFLDPAFITDALAGTIIIIINLIAGAFHLNVVSQLKAQIARLNAKLPPAQQEM